MMIGLDSTERALSNGTTFIENGCLLDKLCRKVWLQKQCFPHNSPPLPPLTFPFYRNVHDTYLHHMEGLYNGWEAWITVWYHMTQGVFDMPCSFHLPSNAHPSNANPT